MLKYRFTSKPFVVLTQGPPCRIFRAIIDHIFQILSQNTFSASKKVPDSFSSLKAAHILPYSNWAQHNFKYICDRDHWTHTTILYSLETTCVIRIQVSVAILMRIVIGFWPPPDGRPLLCKSCQTHDKALQYTFKTKHNHNCAVDPSIICKGFSERAIVFLAPKVARELLVIIPQWSI